MLNGWTDAPNAIAAQVAMRAMNWLVTIIEWRDLYHNFEGCFDVAEKITDTIQSAVMKNA